MYSWENYRILFLGVIVLAYFQIKDRGRYAVSLVSGRWICFKSQRYGRAIKSILATWALNVWLGLGGGFRYFYFHPYLGKIPILTNIQLG